MRWACVVVGLVFAACGVAGAGSAADPFAYSAGAPLDIRTGPSRVTGGLRITKLTYASPRGGRVPAVVVAPAQVGGLHPGLLVQHSFSTFKEDFLEVAEDFAQLGAIVVLIDAPIARGGGPRVTFTRRDRDDQIQLIVDLRRAVDLLRARSDVDVARIAYLGSSYGGAMGGLLAGVEHRIRGFVLMVGDGGLVQHFTGPEDRAEPFLTLPAARRRRWLAAMTPIEPLRWVRKATAPLLFLNARYDEFVPPRDARAYQRAAPQPKEIHWYDSGHRLPPEAWCDAARFLERRIGIPANEHPSC